MRKKVICLYLSTLKIPISKNTEEPLVADCHSVINKAVLKPELKVSDLTLRVQCYSMFSLRENTVFIGWKFWKSHCWAGNYSSMSRKVRAVWGPGLTNPHLPWWALLCEWPLFYQGFSGSWVDKESACNVEDLGLIPGLGSSQTDTTERFYFLFTFLFYHICTCSSDVSKYRKSGMFGTTWRRSFRKLGKSDFFPQHSSEYKGRTLICWVPWTEVRFLSWPHPRLLEDSNSCYDIHHTFGLGLTTEEQEIR